MKRGESRANANRRLRNEEMREKLRAYGHHDQAVEIIKKLKDLDEEMDNTQVARLSKALDSHLKFVNKYLPDPKEVHHEHTGEDGAPINSQITFVPVSAKD